MNDYEHFSFLELGHGEVYKGSFVQFVLIKIFILGLLGYH